VERISKMSDELVKIDSCLALINRITHPESFKVPVMLEISRQFHRFLVSTDILYIN
jgi:hypothetical protein